MSGSQREKQRRLFIRVAIILLWVSLGVVIFILNRGHSVLVDNHNLDDFGFRAPDLIKVSIDAQKPLEFFRGDRDLFKVKGKNHRINIEFSDGTPPFQGQFSLPLGPDMFLLSLPKMIMGMEPFLEVFITQQESREADTEMENEE